MPIIVTIYLTDELGNALDSALSEALTNYKPGVVLASKDQLREARRLIETEGRRGVAAANAYLRSVQKPAKRPTRSSVTAELITEAITARTAARLKEASNGKKK